MILDDTATRNMAQQAANMSNLPQTIYRRADGSYLFCAKGNVQGLKMVLKPNEQLSYIDTINPSERAE